MDESFTMVNVARMTYGLVSWLKEESAEPKVVIGFDCRRNGKLYADTVTAVLLRHGVEVLAADEFVSTPMVSLAARDHTCTCGVMITASHNPPEYNGYKLKSKHGGPMQGDDLARVEEAIPDTISEGEAELILTESEQSSIKKVDLEAEYIQAAESTFDLDAIRNSDMGLAYDAMFGAGQSVMKKLLPEITFHQCELNPTFDGISPEPILRNLKKFSALISENAQLDCGLATDGDADRIGLFDGDGRFIDAHHIILLLIHYLHKYKGQSGKCVTGFSSVTKISKMCKLYGLPLDVVKIGFKYASGIMINEPVMVGGEESGGIAVDTHIPERDGIWMGLIIWEFMAKTGKTLKALIEEVYEVVGPFVFERNDLRLDESVKLEVVENCRQGHYSQFDDLTVIRVEDLDGWKFFFSEESWVMIRPSGTEPVLRIYAEAPTQAEVTEILEKTKKSMLL